MKKIIGIISVLAIAVTMTSCKKKTNDSEVALDENVIIHPAETQVKTTTAETITEKASEDDDFQDVIYYTPPVQLPDDIAEGIENIRAEDFVYSEHLDGQHDWQDIIAIDDKYVYFEKMIENFNDTSDLAFYKYDLATGEATEFDGIVSDMNTKSAEYAFTDGRIYSVMYGTEGRVSYSLDTQANRAEILETDETSSDSMVRNIFVFDEEAYAEKWSTGMGYLQTVHVKIHDKNGDKEIITKEYNSSTEKYLYTANGGHIYEYVYKIKDNEPYLNIYNKDGELESTEYLEEIAYELGSNSGYYVWNLTVSGRFLSFEMENPENPDSRAYIYDMETGNYCRMDNCYGIATSNYLPPDFGKMLFVEFDEAGCDLYCLYENGDILKLSENIGHGNRVTNGEKAAYFKDQQLYTIEY